MRISASEWKRKAVHAGMGLFALTLRWLDWKQAAACALAALLLNLFVLPRFARGISRGGTGRDAGIVSYPAMVLALVLLFRGESLPIAAAVWAMMAFGDPAASIFGRLAGGPRLPWNRDKTWIGLAANWAFGSAGAVLVFAFVSQRHLEPNAVAMLVAGAALFALLETVRSGIDDNLVPALPTALFLTWLAMPHPGALTRPSLAAALAVNAAVAFAAWAARAVSLSGAIAGAVAGSAILAGGGAGAYGVLWSFFLVGTLASRFGYAEKRKAGTAQASGGRRGAEHVAANCAVAALIAVLASFQADWGIPFAACFAAALADTLGTEFGSLYGKRPFSPLGGGRLPVGTPGAVSAAGLLAGVAGAAIVALAARAGGVISPAAVWIVAAAGFAGALAESVLADFGRRAGFRLDHEFANAANTFLAACFAMEIWRCLASGGLYVPVAG